MVTTDERKSDKLVIRLTALVDEIELEWRRDFKVQQSIDKFYFIQKSVELKLLYKAFQMNRVAPARIETQYRQVYYRWRKDVRWLHAHRLKPYRD